MVCPSVGLGLDFMNLELGMLGGSCLSIFKDELVMVLVDEDASRKCLVLAPDPWGFGQRWF